MRSMNVLLCLIVILVCLIGILFGLQNGKYVVRALFALTGEAILVYSLYAYRHRIGEFKSARAYLNRYELDMDCGYFIPSWRLIRDYFMFCAFCVNIGLFFAVLDFPIQVFVHGAGVINYLKIPLIIVPTIALGYAMLRSLFLYDYDSGRLRGVDSKWKWTKKYNIFTVFFYYFWRRNFWSLVKFRLTN